MLQLLKLPFAPKPILATACVTTALLAATLPAQAASYTWMGEVDNKWETAGNWSPNGIPGGAPGTIVNIDTVVINGPVTVVRTMTNQTLGFLSGSIGSGTVTAFSLTGGAKLDMRGTHSASAAPPTLPIMLL